MIHEIRGGVTSRRSGDDPDVREHLIAALRSHGATVTLQEDGTVVFHGSWLVMGWDVLAPVSRVEVSVERGVPGSCRVQYRLSLFRVRLWCAIFTAIISVLMILAEWPILLVLGAVCGIWAWLYGGNWAVTALRFHTFIEKTIAISAGKRCGSFGATLSEPRP